MPKKEIHHWTVPYLQVLDEKGKADPDLEPDLSPEDLKKLYRAMVLSREADQRMLNLQRQGRIGTFPPGMGQEAAFCAPTLALNEKDWLVGAFREPGARMMRGENLARALLLYNGFEEGNIPPPGGERTLPVSIIVAAQTLHAVGIGYAMKYKGEKDTAVLAFFGDGATSEGDFYEALNFASLWEAPVVFLCQNNQYAISVPRSKQTRSRTLAQKALAHDIPCIQVDGNDALGMYSAAREALERARSGGGPTLVEAVTYRLAMHTTADDPGKYRSKEEEEEWRAKDPIPRLRTYLEGKGLWDSRAEDSLREEVKKALDEEVKTFESIKDFKPDACFDHVFGTTHPWIEKQRKEFLAELEKEERENA